MNSLGLPQGFEAFHEVKDMDDLDDISLGSAGDISVLTMNLEEGEGQKEDDESKPTNEDGNGNSANGPEGHAVVAAQQEEPRMVSHDSMATVRAANVQHHIPNPPPQPKTPYDSLKSLIENKRKSRGGNLMAPSASSSGIASRPSTFLREALYGSGERFVAPQHNQNFDGGNVVTSSDDDNNDQQPANKKSKVMDREVQNHVLHKACMKRGAEAEVIAAILKIDPNLAGISHQIFQVKEVYDCVSYKKRSTKVKEKYCYPLNIAIRNRVQYAAIELLVKAAPQVMAIPDGSMKEGSLSILLKNDPQDMRLADLLLLSNPASAKLLDKHNNTPLHIACQYGASLPIVKHICILHPGALKMKNRFGQTPIQVAQRSNRSGDVAFYLLVKQKGIY